MNCPQCHGKGQINQMPCDYDGCHNGFIHCCDGDQVTYKNCRWCNKLVNSEDCWALYTGVSLVCELCGSDVTGRDDV